MLSLTVNVGVYSSLLANFFDGVDFRLEDEPPVDTSNCALKTRLGLLMPAGQDLWWKISLANIHQMASEVGGLIDQYGRPFIASKIDDQSLVDYWSPLLSDLGYKELRFLAVLTCHLGASQLMVETLEVLKERWGHRDMVLDLGSFIENLKTRGVNVRPVLSESALMLRRSMEKMPKKSK